MHNYVVPASVKDRVVSRMGKLLAQMGVVPDGFPYDNMISAALRDILGGA